jgi:hypothetical protein
MAEIFCVFNGVSSKEILSHLMLKIFGFEVMKAVTINSRYYVLGYNTISQVEVHRRFGDMFCFHFCVEV